MNSPTYVQEIERIAVEKRNEYMMNAFLRKQQVIP